MASHHFNFSVLEPMGVVSVISSNESALLGLVSTIAPIIVGAIHVSFYRLKTIRWSVFLLLKS